MIENVDPGEVAKAGFRALNSVVRPVVKAGVGNPLLLGGGAIVLETRGRTSGLPREVPLLAQRFGDTLIVSTVRSNSQWLKNIEADPAVIVNLLGRRREATAVVRRGPLNIVTIRLLDADADS